MGYESPFNKPKSIREAVYADDVPLLRAAGKKGARATNKIKEKERKKKEVIGEVVAELRAREGKERLETANEHIIDSDGVDQDYYSGRNDN